MALGGTYRTGTVSTDAASPPDLKKIIGDGTLWTTAVVAGDLFCAGGLVVPIAEVVDDETLELEVDWPGSALSGDDYVIVENAISRSTQLAIAANLSEAAQRWRSLFTQAMPIYAVVEFGLTTPPGSPSVDDKYVVGASATGAWAGQDDNIAVKTANGWAFLEPERGWHVDSATDGSGTNVIRHWTGTEWEMGGGLARAPKYEGAWDSGTAYTTGDVVSRLNVLYIASQEGTNKAPESNSDYWDTLSTVGVHGGAFTLQYVLKTSTTASVADTDGQINSSASLGSSPTTLRVNIKDAFGTNWSSLLATIATASTSANKGKVRIVVIGDGSKQFVADVTASALDSGNLHYNLTLTNQVTISAGSISDGTSVLLMFEPKGDKGDTGPTGATGPTGPFGGPISIPQTFKAGALGDSDPGDGFIGLDTATGTSATVIRSDLKNSDGSDVTGSLDLLSGFTGTVIGVGSIRHQDTPTTKWLSFLISAYASPTGYRNVSVSNVAGSSASPFADNDPVVFSFTPLPKGDTGATGATGATGSSFSPQNVVATLDLRDAYDGGPAVDGDGNRLSVLVEEDSSNDNKPTLYFLLTAGTGSPVTGAVWSQGILFSPGSTADGIEYDNTAINVDLPDTTPLSSTDLQAATDEIVERISDAFAEDETDIASASTTDIGAVNTKNVRITGTTPITSFGTHANCERVARFAAALTLTHNGTSLILPGGENIAAIAGDMAWLRSDSSGNWRVVSYIRQREAFGTIASASTCDLGSAAAGYLNVTGTTPITSFGSSAPTGAEKELKFAAACPITHNSTSLILPGGISLTTQAGDTMRVRHEGSGNWRVVSYMRAAVSPNGVVGLFHVDRNGTNQTGLTAGTYNKISFTNEVVDKRGWFDNATNFRFQPTEAGYYFFHAQVNSNTGTSGETCQAALYKNGSQFAVGFYLSASSAASAVTSVSAVIFLNGSTDYVEAFVYLPASVTTLQGDAKKVYFEGYKLTGT